MTTASFEQRVKHLELIAPGATIGIRRNLVKESVLSREGLKPYSKLERVWVVSMGVMLVAYGRTLEEAFTAVEAKARRHKFT